MSGQGQVLFEFVRHWARHTPESGTTQGRLVVVVEAVHALALRSLPATINAVAQELGIDQSGASRWITAAAERGYVELQVSTSDGRSRHAIVSSIGHEMLAHAHTWQEQVYEQLTEGWSAERRSELKRALNDMLNRSHELNG